MPETIRLRDPDGTIVDVDVSAAGGYLQDPRWSIPTADDEIERVSGLAREAEYGGVGGQLIAGGAALARGLTVGGSDAFARAIGGDDAAIALSGYRDVNPATSTTFEIGGAIAPALVTGGASLPAGAAALAGRGAARAAGGGLRGALAGGVVEGGIQGFGAGVTELSLSTDRLTLERAASALGSNVLLGAATGGIAEAGVHGIGRGLARANKAIDDVVAKREARKAATPEDAVDSGDLSILDKRALDVLEKDEIARIKVEQAPQRRAIVEELDQYRNVNRNADDLRAIIKASDDRDVVEAGASFVRQDKELRRFLDSKADFANDPTRAGRPLRAQQQSIEEIQAWGREQERLWREAVDDAPRRVREEILAGKVHGEKGPFTPAGLDLAVEREIAERSKLQFGGAFETGLKAPSIVRRMADFDRVLEWNLKFQKQIDELAKPPSSDRLTKIAEARAALEIPQAPSVGGALLAAVTPFSGPLGAVAASGGRLVKSLRDVAAAAADKTLKAAARFTRVASRAAADVEPYTPVIATKVLQSVRYAARDDDDEEPHDLPALVKRRMDEIKSQTEYDPTGTPVMRVEARAEIAAKLRPIAMVDPLAADQLEEIAARRIEFLSSIMPRQPDFGGLGVPDWQPSDMQQASFARSVAAAEDPAGVEDRAAAGAITPEDVAAYWAVYPERAEDFKQQILAERETLQQKLPYPQRLSLSMLVGRPIDPSLHPRVIAKLQNQFPAEPGSQGGVQAPRPQPQFGAMRKHSESARTPAQERQK